MPTTSVLLGEQVAYLARDGSRATLAEQQRVVVHVRHCQISHSREYNDIRIVPLPG